MPLLWSFLHLTAIWSSQYVSCNLFWNASWAVFFWLSHIRLSFFGWQVNDMPLTLTLICHWHVIGMQHHIDFCLEHQFWVFFGLNTEVFFACMSLNVMRVVRQISPLSQHWSSCKQTSSRWSRGSRDQQSSDQMPTGGDMSSRGHCHALSFAFCRLLVRTLKWDLLLLFDFLKRTPLAVLASRRGFDLQMCFCCKLSKRLHPSRELKSAKHSFHDMILDIWQMFCKIGLTVFL